MCRTMQTSGRDFCAFGALGDDHLTILVLPEHVDVVPVPASIECEVECEVV